MTNPTLRFRPLRPAVAADGASTLDLLITITPLPRKQNPSDSSARSASSDRR